MARPAQPRIVFCTTPIRPVPTDYPPVGSLSVISALQRAGFTGVEFYNIDLTRPSFDEAVAHIVERRPDILAVSAVVSTAYEYTKKLTLAVKSRLPGVTILLGGNMGTSAEILLNRTGVDFICTGEGERTAVDFVRAWVQDPSRDEYGYVKGLSYLDSKGAIVVTPYAEALKAEELYEIDWTIMEKLDQLDYFITPAAKSGKLAVTDREDPRIMEIKRLGKRTVMLNTCKGCVARCTFCHRWDKGIRYIPVPVLMQRLDDLIARYNVGFVRMGDENFGTDKRWLGEFCAEVKKRGVLWRVGGMRVNCIDPEWIDRMKDAGCVTIFYGMESGSQKMLDVMEKKTTAEQNRNAMKWMVEKSVSTTIQLIVGMPGECHETIAETADFLAYSATLSPDWDPNNVSVNFAQALPGTPLYEAGRSRGLIGRSLDDEEAYLIKISDRDARDGETAINFTGFPRLTLERWHYDLQSVGRFAFIKKFGPDAYRRILAKSALFEEPRQDGKPGDSGYFAAPARLVEGGGKTDKEAVLESSATADTLHAHKDRARFRLDDYPSILRLVRMRKFFLIPILHPEPFMRLRVLSTMIVFLNAVRKYGPATAPSLIVEYALWKAKTLLAGPTKPAAFDSLRKTVAEAGPLPGDTPAMAALRAGR
ncbi:MAG: cobalamin B12-binding domain-containing protein [Elusimicrobia bacterium]|nr:cobalamin B12-binding domain-containing protein [Elusimicrobiota bacterium]